MTHNNETNQLYLLNYNKGLILDTLVKLYRLCDSEIPLYPTTDINDKESTGTVIRETLLVTLKVLINLTHHFNKSCKSFKPNIIVFVYYINRNCCSGRQLPYRLETRHHRRKPSLTPTNTSLHSRSEEIRIGSVGKLALRIKYSFLIVSFYRC